MHLGREGRVIAVANHPLLCSVEVLKGPGFSERILQDVLTWPPEGRTK